MTIREANENDALEINNLYKSLCPGEPVNVVKERINEIRNDNSNYLFVYDVNGNILGTIFLTLCKDPMFNFQPYGLIENVIVDEKSRGKKIGEKLMLHVEKYCIDNDCTKIMLLSNSKRTSAHKFFEKIGYDKNISIGFKKYINRKNAAQQAGGANS